MATVKRARRLLVLGAVTAALTRPDRRVSLGNSDHVDRQARWGGYGQIRAGHSGGHHDRDPGNLHILNRCGLAQAG